MEKTEQLKLLFGNNAQYTLPSYQRGYAWENRQIEEFLEDLDYVTDSDNAIHEHFFGSFLLAASTDPSDKATKIIDGQQRITSSLLFLICARNFFYFHKDNSDKAAKYCDQIEKIIYAPPANPDPNLNKARLTLSKPNKPFFLELLRSRSTVDPTDTLEGGLNDSNILLGNAYKTMSNWINKKSGLNSDDTQNSLDIDLVMKNIYNFVNTLTGKFVIFRCNCDNESEAYRIFNLVNNRGTKLSDSDLIKSFLFGKLTEYVGSGDIDSYDISWNEMRRHVTSRQTSSYDLDRYLYHHLLAFHSSNFKSPDNNTNIVRLKQKYMYDSYEKLVGKYNIPPQNIIKSLLEWSRTLTQIRNPTEVNFLQKDNVIHYLKKIRKVNAVFVYPAILAGYAKYWKPKNYKEFEALVMLCFKYHIRMKAIGTSISLGAYQDTMYDIMNQIVSGDPVADIIKDIVSDRRKYPCDNTIEANLRELRVKNAQLAIALLEEIESVYSKKHSPYNVSIEHIMPKTLTPWLGYIIENNSEVTNETEAKDFHRQRYTLLGNLTLLPADINISISNKSFEDKKKEYAKHKTFRMTELLSKIPVWNGQAMSDRQTKLSTDLVKAINLNNIIGDLKLT